MSSGSQRAFASKINKRGSAAEVRRKLTSSYFSRPPSQILLSDVVTPPDFEDFFSTNATSLERDPLRSTFTFPQDDLHVDSIEKKHKFIPKKGHDLDKHALECILLYNKNIVYLKKKYELMGFGEERLLEALRSPTPEFQAHRGFKDSSLSLVSCSESLVSGGGDGGDDGGLEGCLLESLLTDIQQADMQNEQNRTRNRHDAFLSLYSHHNQSLGFGGQHHHMQPYEYPSHKLFVKCTRLNLDLDIEPIFASFALYDLQHGKKISENFHFDLNSEDNLHMLQGHIPCRDFSTLARSAILNITFPCPDIFLVVKLEKVLQQGELSEVVEPYLQKDDKLREKARLSARQSCGRLGRYRMSFAWTAVHLMKVIHNSGSCEVKKPDTFERNKGSSYRPDKRASCDEDDLVGALASFKPITVTLSNFYKHEIDKASDEDLFKFLAELKKQPSSIKKIKPIPGTLMMDLSMCCSEPPNVLSPELAPLDLRVDANIRPTKQVLEFPTKDVFAPHSLFRNLLFVYPKHLNFANRQGSARNIAIKVEVFDGVNPEPLNIIFGKSSCAEMSKEVFTNVSYHTKTPSFSDEMKMALPTRLSTDHHLLFTFYHVSCQPKKDSTELESVVGYSWLPLLRDRRLVSGEFWLPVCTDTPPSQYFLMHPDVQLPNMRWVDNHKGLFNISLDPISTIHTLDENLDRFIEGVAGVEGHEDLTRALTFLSSAKVRSLVEFMHVVLNKLIKLMLSPPVGEGKMVDLLRQKCFETMNEVVQKVDSNPLIPTNHLSHNQVLLTYVNCYCQCGPFNNQARPPSKLLHEELVQQWTNSKGAGLSLCFNNSPFLLQLILKSMGDHLMSPDRLKIPRKQRFSSRFSDDLCKLVEMVARKLLTTPPGLPKEGVDLNKLNMSIAHFLKDSFSLMDRGFVFNLIRTYYKLFSEAIASNMHADLSDTFDHKLDFLQVLCTQEHFLSLNLPFPIHPSTPPSPTSSMESMTSQISYDLQNDYVDYLRCWEVNGAYKSQHFLLGILFSELKCALDTNISHLQHKAISIFFNLISSHDSDSRYDASDTRCRIANLYFPLVTTATDTLPLLYHPCHKSAYVDFPSSIGMVIAGSTSYNLHSEDTKSQTSRGGGLTPEATKDLLACVMWVLKSADRRALWHWWSRCSHQQLNKVIEVLNHAVNNFEFKEEKTSRSQVNVPSKSEYKNRIEEAILGSNSARMKMIRRKDLGAAATTGSGGGGGSDENGSKLRWKKDKVHYKQVNDSNESKSQHEAGAKVEKLLSHEINLIVIDVLEFIIQLIQSFDNLQNCLSQVLRVLLHCLSLNQSSFVLQNLFATQRSLVLKFPELLFEEDTEQCADLCLQLLSHCSSPLPSIRTHASASLYMLMRQNFEIGNNFARVKMQVTMSLSTLVGQTESCNGEQLKHSLKSILHFSDVDVDLKETTFPDQVRDLVMNLHMILSDTFKMKEYQSDPEMLLDIMYRIAKGYQNSPDLRLTWLENMASKHIERKNHGEAAQCLLHAAGLVSEYLNMLEDKSYLPIGCVALQHVSRNILEESAVSEDVVSPEEEGICAGKSFSEAGLCSLLERACQLFRQAAMYEVIGGVYKVLMPVYENNRDFHKLASLHNHLHEAFSCVIKMDGKRIFGTYFRVGFYGERFADLDEQEFIYKEPAITKLPEISHRLEYFYSSKFGESNVEMIKDSNNVEKASLNPTKAYIQITYVEPYFDLYEMKERQTFFEHNYNIKRFMYATPFTKEGKAHGELNEQYKRKTVLTTSHAFPYIKTRLLVIHKESCVLSPIEVAIEDLQKKKKELCSALRQEPPDVKMLQMVLQGCIGATVNQGPIEMASTFLSGEPALNKFHNKLRGCFKDFLKKCDEALVKNKGLISEEQKDYQHELEKKFKSTRECLIPLLNSH